jgi:hypothetical protein
MATIDLRDHRGSWTEPQTALATGPAALTFLVITLLSAALVIRQPLFGFYVFTGYFWAWRLLEGRARFVGVALVAATVAISQTGAGPYRDAGAIAGLVAVYLVNVGIAGTLTWFGWVSEEQHQRRGRELTELTEAHAQLERMMRETPSSRSSCSPRPGRRALPKSAGGWHVRFTTRSRRGSPGS